MDEDKFQGGGTPIGAIIPQQPQYPPQQQQYPPQQQPQYPQQQQQQPQYPPQQPQYPPPPQSKKFEDIFKMSTIQFVVLVSLIIVINSPYVLSLMKNFIPHSINIGNTDPPFILIIFNAFLIALVYGGLNNVITK